MIFEKMNLFFDNKNNYFYYVVFFVALMLNRAFPLNNDDFLALELGFLEGVDFFWNYCNPRWSNMLVPILITENSILIDVFNSLLAVLFIWLCERLTGNKQIWIFLIVGVFPGMWTDGYLWATGSLNYFLPLILLVWSMLIYQKEQKWWHILVYFMVGFSNEFNAPALIIWMFIMDRKKLLNLLPVVLGYAIFMTAPGSYNRAASLKIDLLENILLAPERIFIGLKQIVPAFVIWLYTRKFNKKMLALCCISGVILCLLGISPVKNLGIHRGTMLSTAFAVLAVGAAFEGKIKPYMRFAAILILITWFIAITNFRNNVSQHSLVKKVFVGVEHSKHDKAYFWEKYNVVEK